MATLAMHYSNTFNLDNFPGLCGLELTRIEGLLFLTKKEPEERAQSPPPPWSIASGFSSKLPSPSEPHAQPIITL